MSQLPPTALELRDSIARGELSCVEAATASLAVTERLDSEINAFTATYPEHSVAAAAAVDKRLAAGEELPLAGVPYALKDLTDTAGFVTTYGSPAFRDHVPAADAAIAARMRESGGIFLGKTNTPEFGGRPTTAFGLFGATRNPWDSKLSAGGSSGGSAAAVAAGMCPLAEGSDTGGSIRIPASCCAVVGLKPSRGLVPTEPRAALGGLFTHGPLARTVADAALMLDVLSGRTPANPLWLEAPATPFLAAVGHRAQRSRVAIVTGSESADPQVVDAVRATADLLSDLGHDVEPGGPDLGSLGDAIRVMEEVGFATISSPPSEFIDPYSRHCHERGRAVTAVEYLEAIATMQARADEILAFFEDWDHLLTPTVTQLPQPVDAFGTVTELVADEDLEYTRYLFAFNITGQPAISLPLAWSREGLPIGIQLVGRAGEDRALLTLAGELERAQPWAHRHPKLREGVR